MHWYQRDPDAALAGMSELTFEERGAYNSIIDLLYSRDGDLSDDDERVARMLNCQRRTWAKLKARLIQIGKVWVKDGKIYAKRVEKTLKRAAEVSEKQRKKAEQRWQKHNSDNEINDGGDAAGNASTTTTTTTTTEDKKDSELRSDDWPSDFREQFWSEYPRRVGKQGAIRELDRARKRGISFVRLIAAVRAYASAADPQFTKHPKTWLVNGCWDDEPLKSKTATMTAFTITPESRSWNAWKSHYRDTKQQFSASHMDRCASDGKPFTVPSEWPPGHKQEAA